MANLFAGLPVPSWQDPPSPYEPDKTLMEGAKNFVSSYNEVKRDQLLQTGTQAQLKVDEMKQNLQINQAELNNQAADQSTIPQWMQDHPTWASRQDADWPTAKSSWGEKALQQTQLRDNQSSQKEFTVNAITGFQDRLNKLAAMGGDASDAATVVAQLPRDQKTNLPSPQAVMQLNQAEKMALQQARQNKITDAVAVDTAKEKLGEQRDASKLAGQQTRDSQKHEWVVENIDHRYDLSAQTAVAKFTNQKNLAKFNQEATVIRSSALSPEQQAARMKDLELKYKADFKGNGAFHDFQDDGTPKDDAMASPVNAGVSLAESDKYDTKLSNSDEQQFQFWRQKYAPNDSGSDYDLRGAFKAGLKPSPENGHWPDTYKKPNHETYSIESKFSKDYPQGAGSWDGDTYIPSKDKVPVDLPSSKDRLVRGNIYKTKNGPAKWDGTQFVQ